MNKKWDLTGKYVVITGATSGIGLAAAKQLAAQGANLGIVARNQARADQVAAQLKNSTTHSITVDVFLADLASQQSIHQLAANILEKCPRVDVLINNAGALFETRQMTPDNLEMTWAVNHLAPFLLTTLLLDRLKQSEHAGIITTASHGHKMSKHGINFDDLSATRLYSFPKKFMGGSTFRYAETKLANILFTLELGRQLEGTNVAAYCFDPGLIATNFNQNNGRVARLTMAVLKKFSCSPEKGAETLVWLAEAAEVGQQNGKYYTNKQIATPALPAQDRAAARRLWKVSEEQVRPLESIVENRAELVGTGRVNSR